MIISNIKRKENYAEYILYMWQVEDLIRANNCDIEKIKTSIIPHYESNKVSKKQLIDWWDNLSEMMKIEKKEKSGHLQILINSVNDLNNFHLQLLSSLQHLSYQMKFSSISSLVKELNDKVIPKPQNDIEAMLIVIYLTIMMKIRGDEITENTKQSVEEFGEFLALLSKLYKDNEEGKIDWDVDKN